MSQIRNIENKFKLNTTVSNLCSSIKEQDDYLLYLSINTTLHNHGGYFTLDDLVPLFRDELGYQSLKQKPNIYKFKKDLYERLKKSTIFFKHVKGEKFKLISNRKILNQLGTTKHKSIYYYFPKEFLKKKNKTIFRDLIIGCFLLTHKGYSNTQVAKHFNITVARVQNATRRNNESYLIRKQLRLIQGDSFDTLTKAITERRRLWNLKIATKIKKLGDDWYIYYFRTNTYESYEHWVPSHRVKTRAERYMFRKKYSKIVNDIINVNGLGYTETIKLNDYQEFNSYFNFDAETWNSEMYIKQYGITL